jgi:hypothetical protein
VLNPPAADLGRVRAVTAAGIREWRIAAREPALVLVQAGADYALAFAPEAGAGLLDPGLLDPAAGPGE